MSRPPGGSLCLDFILTGSLEQISWPPPAQPARVDGLWRRTCFEAFVAPGPGKAYREFNFSPSGEWAAYAFSGYREEMAPAMVSAPSIEFVEGPGQCALRVGIDLDDDGDWRLALSAVIEDLAGDKSYWALAHPPGRPDFHHPAALALELPAPESA